MKHRPKHETAHDSNGGIGSNLKSIVVVAILMLLMMFAVHCTWVTSNAYSSPSIVLAFYNGNDGLESFSLYYLQPKKKTTTKTKNNQKQFASFVVVSNTELETFWMISVKHTTGYHKIRPMMHGLCHGGIMGIR